MPPLTATYTSSSATNAPSDTPPTFTHPLPAIPASPSTHDRVAFLAALQSSIRSLQSDINSFLTQKMEEDKAGKMDDAAEEENYGEELVEGD